MSNRHAQTFTAGPADIDELGHVNNAVWVDWIQQIATDALVRGGVGGAPGPIRLGRDPPRDRL